MNHTTILNLLAEKFNYQSFLELGVFSKELNYNHINCPIRMGVDINPMSEPDFCGTTDEFFEYNDKTWNLVLVDASHEEEQVTKDVLNAISCLSDGGSILMHDCLPETEIMQRIPRQTMQWTGNVYRTWIKLRQERDDLTMRCINADFGCGLIQKGKQKKLKLREEITFASFLKNKQAWMNIISVEEFEKWLKAI